MQDFSFEHVNNVREHHKFHINVQHDQLKFFTTIKIENTRQKTYKSDILGGFLESVGLRTHVVEVDKKN